jgi:hypothetical protein
MCRADSDSGRSWATAQLASHSTLSSSELKFRVYYSTRYFSVSPSVTYHGMLWRYKYPSGFLGSTNVTVPF